MIKKILNYVSFVLFFWKFNDGLSPSFKQMGMFSDCQASREKVDRVYSRNSGATTFLSTYSAWLAGRGFKVGFFTSPYGKMKYFSGVANIKNIKSAGAYVFHTRKMDEKAKGLSLDYIIVDNTEVDIPLILTLNGAGKKLIRIDTI